MGKKLKIIIAFAILPQILFIKIISNYPNSIEYYYSNGLYPYIAKALRFSFGYIPFSVGDLLYTLAGILILRYLFTQSIFKNLKQFGLDLLVVLSIAYFSFHVFWGFNYYRVPLQQTLNLEERFSKEELIDLTEQLLAKTNQIHLEITKDADKKVIVPYTKSELLKKSHLGFDRLKNVKLNTSLGYSSAKKSIYSLALTYMGYSGYLNPFTNEAQINSLMPDYKLPFVSTHETAHQLGYSAENEANFIGYLGAINNPDLYFQFSAYSFALRYCLAEISYFDTEKYNTMVEQINPGILVNFKEAITFWEAYENPLEPIFKQSYNTFLKANNQSQGIKSYSLVVTLLVNYYKGEEL